MNTSYIITKLNEFAEYYKNDIVKISYINNLINEINKTKKDIETIEKILPTLKPSYSYPYPSLSPPQSGYKHPNEYNWMKRYIQFFPKTGSDILNKLPNSHITLITYYVQNTNNKKDEGYGIDKKLKDNCRDNISKELLENIGIKFELSDGGVIGTSPNEHFVIYLTLKDKNDKLLLFESIENNVYDILSNCLLDNRIIDSINEIELNPTDLQNKGISINHPTKFRILYKNNIPVLLIHIQYMSKSHISIIKKRDMNNTPAIITSDQLQITKP